MVSFNDKPGDISGKKILVTGAAGFIGSNLSDMLLSKGAKVIGIDNFFNGRAENLANARKNPNFEFKKADIRDYDFMFEVTRDVDIIYHEAAFTSVPQSILMPGLCNEVNVQGTINILNAARRNDVDRVIFASSSAVYGDTPTLPKHEKMQQDPISPYGVSKLAGESYLRAYYLSYGLKTTALRYFNVFGPRQRNSPYSGVIAIFLAKIMDGESPIIFGDGTQTRDFTYVKDVIQANILAATSEKSPGKIINVAAGAPISLNDLTKAMLTACQREDLKILYEGVRTGDILHSFGDISLSKELLGYTPQFTPLSGLTDLITRFKNKEFEL